MKKFLLGLSVLLLFPFVANAQVEREVEKSVKIYFRQGAVVLDEDYKDNRAVLTDFANEVKNYYNDSTAQFRQIRVLSSTSPEGGAAVNDRIAKRRAAAISEWISREINAKVGYEVVSMGLDWGELIDLVQGSDEVPYRDEVLALLQDTDESLRHDALVSCVAVFPIRGSIEISLMTYAMLRPTASSGGRPSPSCASRPILSVSRLMAQLPWLCHTLRRWQMM